MASYIKVTNTVNLPVSFNPQTAFPLDARSIVGSYSEAVAAAASAENAGSSNTVYYIGQTLTVFENDEVNLYQIQPDKTLKLVGTVPVGDDKSITVDKDGKISIKSFGKEYYEYIAADNIIPTGDHTYPDNMPAEASEGSYIKIGDQWYKYTSGAWATTAVEPKTTAEYKLVTGWKAGLEPKVVQSSDGAGFEIAWYEPSSTTIEGLNSIVGSVQTQVENLTEVVNNNKLDAEAKIAAEETRAKGEEDALKTRVTAVETTTTRLDADAKTEGSVKNQIALAVAKIMDNPDETLNSIKELVDWINTHNTEALTMSNNIDANTKAIDALEKLVGTLPEGVTATDVVGYIQEAVAAEKTRATGVEDGLSGKITTLESATKDLQDAIKTLAKDSEVVKSVTAGENGHITVDGSDVKVYELGIAKADALGGIKPDGSTILVDGTSGVASVGTIGTDKVTGLADAINTAKTGAVTEAKEYADGKIAKTDIINSESVSTDTASDENVYSAKAIEDMLTWKTIM